MCTDWGKCPYKRIVRDCDGDPVELCTKYGCEVLFSIIFNLNL